MAPGVWPNGARCAAFFSFDVDGEAWLLTRDARNAERPITLSQAQYGPRVGVFEILRLLKAYGVTATFFIPSWIAERYPIALDAVLTEGHEVALHGHLHENAEALSAEEERDVVGKSIEILERLTGTRPVGHRTPGGEASSSTVQILHEFRVDYSSAYMDDVFPYFHDGTSVLEIPFHWPCDDWWYSMVSPFALPSPDVQAMAPNEHIVSIWTSVFDGIRRMGGVFTLVNHPQVTGRPHRLPTLEALLRRATAADDVWIANGREIDAHYRSARPDRPPANDLS